MKNDWLFTSDEYICSFRSVGVLIRNNKILVQREADGEVYALPGGHVIVGETATESLIREYKEETGAEIICQRLIWTEECFWNWKGKSANKLAFYYLVALQNENDIPDNGEFVSQKDNCDVLIGWIPIEKLKEITIYPTFIQQKIFNIGEHTEHFVSRDLIINNDS